ncbi:MAG: TMEM165/GDT1 family protein [Bdellovibrionota bacterium]
MLETIFGSFALVALSEMGDKTQLLAFSLAARFKRPWTVLAGILVATILNHALASTVGDWVAAQINPRILTITLALAFFVFGLWTLKPDTLDGKERSNAYGPFLTTTVLFFIAEMGDKTQLATVALAAKYRSAVLVTIGTTLGMMFTDGLAVFAGEKLAAKMKMEWVRWIAAVLFFAFGVGALLTCKLVSPILISGE